MTRSQDKKQEGVATVIQFVEKLGGEGSRFSSRCVLFLFLVKTMTVYNFFFAFCVIGLLLIFAYIGWWIYIRISPFYIAVNRIPGPKYLPLIGNVLEIAGGLDR